MNFVPCRRKKKKLESSSTRCADQNGVDPEIYFKTMTVIQLLKPTALRRAGRCRRPAPAELPVKTAAARRGGGGEAVEEVREKERRQTHLPPIQTTTRDREGGTRESVTQRWRRAAVAAVAIAVQCQSRSECVTKDDATGL